MQMPTKITESQQCWRRKERHDDDCQAEANINNRVIGKSRIYHHERMNMVAPRSVLVHRGIIDSLLRHLLDLILDPSSLRCVIIIIATALLVIYYSIERAC
jgi:hypothetical protein